MSRQDIADHLGLTIETVSRILHDLERRGAIKIKGYRSIALRNQFVDGRAEELPDVFEGINSHQTEHTRRGLDGWLISPEGRAATTMRERARS
jgi:DNA-binding transcriptional regulator YhcF (GntR family)